MLGLRRRPAKTHARLAREELSESLDHFVQAANHAADGVGATVGPRMSAARERVTPAADKMRDAAATGLGTTVAVLAPIAVAAKDGGRKVMGMKKKQTRRNGRWSWLAILLAGGAAVGAAGALVLRRRRAQQWEEYDPSRPLDTAADSAKTAMHRAADSVSTTAEEMADKASSAIDTAGSRTGLTRAGSPTAGMATPVSGTGLDSPSSNNRS